MLLACGDTNEPTDVTLGETTFVVIVNPAINDGNQVTVPVPGAARTGVTVSVAGGPSATTNATAIAVLRPVAPGNRTIAYSGGGTTGQTATTIVERDLREIAVATTGSGASEMANINYAFGGTVVEVTPSMTIQQVNAELAKSNLIVFFRSGSYTGDLTFAGSNVTLFGEGSTGGTVTLNGSVTVGGSQKSHAWHPDYRKHDRAR